MITALLRLAAGLLSVCMFVAAQINGWAGHWEAAGLDMIACALFWREARSGK